MDQEIKQLQQEIEYEQMQYDIADEHPTYTAQFSRAHVKHAEKIREMRAKLRELTAII